MGWKEYPEIEDDNPRSGGEPGVGEKEEQQPGEESEEGGEGLQYTWDQDSTRQEEFGENTGWSNISNFFKIVNQGWEFLDLYIFYV